MATNEIIIRLEDSDRELIRRLTDAPKQKLTLWLDDFVENGDVNLGMLQCAVRFRDAIEAAFD